MLFCKSIYITALRGVASKNTAITITSSAIKPLSAVNLKLHAPAIASIGQFRNLHSVRISRNVEFYCSSDLQLPKNTNKLADALGEKSRPMTLLYAWLMSQEKHVKKYVKFYNNLGIDVLRVRVTPYDLLRPTKGSQCVAEQVLDFLHENPCHSPMMIHGFSVGGYAFSEVLVKMEQDYAKHGHLLNRFVGQIWDSVADLKDIPYGTSRAITSNVTLQKSMQKYLEWYLKVRYNSATRHYEKGRETFMRNYLGVPGLFFMSNSDLVATPQTINMVAKAWEDRGYPVYTKCWEHSRHVSHYMMYPKEYAELVLVFLERIGMTESSRQAVSSV